MNRYWVSWWSGNYADEGCTNPPFQYWITGQRNREDPKKDDCSICAMIDASDEEEIWENISKYFPDFEQRFCELTSPDAVPGDRFPDFENRTKL